jgi:hypothetical protein
MDQAADFRAKVRVRQKLAPAAVLTSRRMAGFHLIPALAARAVEATGNR